MVVRIAKPALEAEHYALDVQPYGLKTRSNQGMKGESRRGKKTGAADEVKVKLARPLLGA